MTSSASMQDTPGNQNPTALALRRRRLLARLAAERAELLWQILGIDEQTLTQTPLFEAGDWTVKDLLAHVAAWDRWQHSTMAALLEGEQPDFAAAADWDAFNAAAVEAGRDRTLAEVLSELRNARGSWVAWLRSVPLPAFFQTRTMGEWDWTFPGCLEVQWDHDAEHAAQLARWREEQAAASAAPGDTGPRVVLAAALHAARDDLLCSSTLVPAPQRASRPVCGQWTLKDLIGHVPDWEQVGVSGLRDMAEGRPPSTPPVPDIDTWNRDHAAARRDQDWETCWSDLHETRERFLLILEKLTPATLEQSYGYPWGPTGTVYQWVRAFAAHDREHAQGLRRALADEEEPHQDRCQA
ncbi:MAG: DinB family protein [Chloroflexota bacterium]